MSNIFLIFILAHLICDFITQTDALIQKKHDSDRLFSFNKGLLEHVIHHTVVMLILLVAFNELTWLLLSSVVIVAASHYVIDYYKSVYTDKIINTSIHNNQFFHILLGKKSIHFIVDQSLHLLIIFIVLFVFNNVGSLPEIISTWYGISVQTVSPTTSTIILALSIYIVLLTFASSVFIGELLKDMKQGNTKNDELSSTLVKKDEDLFFQKRYSQIEELKKNISVERTWEKENSQNGKETMKMEFQQFNEGDDNSAGKYIGILERSLIGIFIVAGAYQGLIIIAALKTLTRFKQFDDKNFAEYYLIGTFLSILFALIIGFLIRGMWLAL